jgi:superfamily I DNA and/or RNA helicase
VLLCAPTNVGAANLYARLVAAGHGAEAALAIAADRVPPGTAVLSNDPARRLVCATISARAGPALDAQRFETVLVDEAALCMEAWVWTLLRPEVARLVLAGDTRQLPARVSASGAPLRHERSLMERLVDLKYEHVARLTVQHRMAPELLAFPNAAFYGGALTTGAGAPARGEVVRVLLADAAEEADGTSRRNRGEAAAAGEWARAHADEPDVVLLAPYAAQCRLLLAEGTGREVHTVDSFQGREAGTVVLCVVRDGSAGLGFWDDARRATVALTRARTRLVLVATRPEAWPADAPLRALALGA